MAQQQQQQQQQELEIDGQMTLNGTLRLKSSSSSCSSTGLTLEEAQVLDGPLPSLMVGEDDESTQTGNAYIDFVSSSKASSPDLQQSRCREACAVIEHMKKDEFVRLGIDGSARGDTPLSHRGPLVQRVKEIEKLNYTAYKHHTMCPDVPAPPEIMHIDADATLDKGKIIRKIRADALRLIGGSNSPTTHGGGRAVARSSVARVSRRRGRRRHQHPQFLRALPACLGRARAGVRSLRARG